ncbi:MAG: peptide ABC transporter substrate-binding protein [Gemmatimonadaceae bacterium]
MRLRSLVPLVAVLGCGTADSPAPAERSGDLGGTLVITVAADADVPVPMFAGTVIGAQVGEVLFDRLAEPGEDLNTVGDRGFRGVLADDWSWGDDSLSITFRLNPKARWHDGWPLTARDVRFTLDLYKDPATGSSVASLLSSIDSITAPDSLTAVVWYSKRYPEQFFDVTYQMRVMPEHLLGKMKRADIKTSEYVRKPIGSGPFRFARWEPGAVIEVVADTSYHRGRANLDRIIWTISPDYTASITKLFAGEADFHETIRAENMAELARNPSLKTMQYSSLDYVFLAFQLRDHGKSGAGRPHPIFGNREVRRALTMAVDRQRLVSNVLDSLGRVGVGPFVRAQGMTDTTIAQIPFDLEGAKRLLDSLGWRDADGNGIRENGGRPLRFSIAAPTSSKNRVRMSVLLQEMLKQAGAQVDVEQLELNSFQERLGTRRFDAAMLGWHVDPSPSSIRQTWSTEASRSGDGLNFGSYESAQFDALVDSASVQMDPAKSKAYFRRAYETIIADAPAIWLYEPVLIAGLHRRIRPAAVRADGWWGGLARWSIPTGERIARDNVGLAQKP